MRKEIEELMDRLTESTESMSKLEQDTLDTWEHMDEDEKREASYAYFKLLNGLQGVQDKLGEELMFKRTVRINRTTTFEAVGREMHWSANKNIVISIVGATVIACYALFIFL